MMGGMPGAERAVGLAIMAKAPRAGAVKTRLCPPLRPPEAAELARCFLLDTVERVRQIVGVQPIVAYAPAEALAQFEEAAPGFVLLPQRGRDLGERQRHLVEDALGLGLQAALLIGTDSPTLPRECLDEAVSLVMARDVDVVLGPTEDGGYYLIGLRTPSPALFEGIPWSTPTVLSRILERAQRLGLRVACLPTWFDVDTGADLERLRAALETVPTSRPRHTREFLTRRAVYSTEHRASDGGGAAASRGR
jgi:rSAM/selenodomain-associated transferase 1